MEYRLLTVREVAVMTDLPEAIIEEYARVGLVSPPDRLTDYDVRELCAVRRMRDDLGLAYEATEVVLRMRQRIVQLQRDLRAAHAALQQVRRITVVQTWHDGDWDDEAGR